MFSTHGKAQNMEVHLGAMLANGVDVVNYNMFIQASYPGICIDRYTPCLYLCRKDEPNNINMNLMAAALGVPQVNQNGQIVPQPVDGGLNVVQTLEL